jgi:protein-disulfide isomerase
MDTEDEVVVGQNKAAIVIHVYSWWTPVLGLVMLLAGFLGGYFGRPLFSTQNPVNASIEAVASSAQDPSVQQEALMRSVVEQIRHFKGDPQAPITLVEFGDFQCPYCGRFATGAGRQIDEAYVQNGIVRFGYQHLAFLGPESQWAAEASECAAEQGAFWSYHDKLFESQSGENRGAFSKENLKKFAADLGLDPQAFNECLDSGKYTSIVEAETRSVQALGVRSTPTFLINGRPLIGAQPFEVFQQSIESMRRK